ncbi:hypothetical protein T11_8486, partial [Trichinella zimbabwensis]
MKPPRLFREVFVEKTARGGKMRAKLFDGKPPRDGQNSGGVDFAERKRHLAEKSLHGCSGEFLWRKRHVAEKCVQSCLMESRPVSDKIQVVWILWRGDGTGPKEGLQDCSGENRAGLKNGRGVFGEKTARGGKIRAKLFGGKPPWAEKMEGKFLWRKRHVVEKCVQSFLLESRPSTDKILVVCILWRGDGTGPKGSLQDCSGESCAGPKNLRGVFGGVDFVERKRHGAEKKPP